MSSCENLKFTQKTAEGQARSLFKKVGIEDFSQINIKIVSLPLSEEFIKVGPILEPRSTDLPLNRLKEVLGSLEIRKGSQEKPNTDSATTSTLSHSYSLATANLKQILIEYDKEHHSVSVLSEPVITSDFLIVLVIELPESIYFTYDRLPYEERSSDPPGIAMEMQGSLISVLCREFLETWKNQIQITFEAKIWNAATFRRDSEIIRSALERLMIWLGLSGGRAGDFYDLVDAFNSISTYKYEGAICKGSLAIVSKNHQNIEDLILLKSPVDLKNFRAVRKLLEVSSDNFTVLCDAKEIFGFGKLSSKEAPNDVFLVRFIDHFKWELCYGKKRLLQIAYGKPMFPRERYSISNTQNILSTLFPRINDTEVKDLIFLIHEATQQRHGTTLVISESAIEEANRLHTRKRAYQTSPYKIKESLMNNLTSIDGAILLDPQGNCHAISAILDSPSSEKGDPTRGSRYNSAVDYVEEQKLKKIRCLAIVISEDGSVDLIN